MHGGLSILSGGLSLPDQPFAVGSLHASGEDLAQPLLSASASSRHYSGSLLSLTATTAAPGTAGAEEGGGKYSFLNLMVNTMPNCWLMNLSPCPIKLKFYRKLPMRNCPTRNCFTFVSMPMIGHR